LLIVSCTCACAALARVAENSAETSTARIALEIKYVSSSKR
jgi:hypothetical protein